MCYNKIMINFNLNEINPYIRHINYLVGCNNENHILPWRQLYDYEFLYVCKGKIIVETNTDKYEVRENQLHIMPPHTLHTRYFSDNEECDYFSIHLDLFFDPLLPDFNAHDFYVNEQNLKPNEKLLIKKKRSLIASVNFISCVTIIEPNKMQMLFHRAFRFYESVDELKQFYLKSIVLRILALTIDSCRAKNLPFFSTNDNFHKEIIENFLSYVKDCYTTNITVKNFLQDQSIGERYFSKIFKAEKQITPNEYIIEYRIKQAKKLLLEDKYYIYEIAERVGLSNEYYFSRLFKQRTGFSPLAWIKENKKE